MGNDDKIVQPKRCDECGRLYDDRRAECPHCVDGDPVTDRLERTNEALGKAVCHFERLAAAVRSLQAENAELRRRNAELTELAKGNAARRFLDDIGERSGEGNE